MRKFLLIFTLIAAIFASSSAESASIDVYALAGTASPEELQEAVRQGVNFNVSKDFEDYNREPYYFKDCKDNRSALDIYYGETPLFNAAYSNHNPDSIKFLVSQGLDVNAEGATPINAYPSATPLLYAAAAKNIEAVRALLECDADPYEPDYIMDFVMAPEYFDDASKTILKLFVDAGFDIDIYEETEPYEKISLDDKDLAMPDYRFLRDSRTLLIRAVMEDNPEAVNFLLDMKADPDIRDAANKIALDYALELPANSKLKKSPAFQRLRKSTSAKTGQGTKLLNLKGRVTASFVNAREAPSTDDEILFKLKKGDEIKIKYQAKDEDSVLWYCTENGGWVRAKYIRILK